MSDINNLTEFAIKEFEEIDILICNTGVIYILPFLTILIIRKMSIIDEMKRIIIIQPAMPIILLAFVLFGQCADDGYYSAISVIYSTICSLITIPFTVYLINTYL